MKTITSKDSGSNTTEAITIGRFAPSPTGDLHFGSLIAAVASYLCAHEKNQGKWLLRIEDVDTQRKQKGSVTSIVSTLECYGFKWDDEIIYQSQRDKYYQEALNNLSDKVYSCSCSRKELQNLTNENSYSYNYPGLCREGILNKEVKNPSIRLRTTNDKICFKDLCQSQIFCQKIHTDIGDFILKRRDQLFAYQLAVVVDDQLQNVNQIVRGADLFDNTPRQIYIQQLLNYQTPEYLHFPIATTSDGKKLSKQNQAPQITTDNISNILDNLISALKFLGQSPPSYSDFSNTDELWLWAMTHWKSDNIPKVMSSTYTNNKN